MYMAQTGKTGGEVMANDKLLPVEERFRMLMGNIQAGLAVFSASLVLKRETDENGNDAANLYAVFDDAPEKPPRKAVPRGRHVPYRIFRFRFPPAPYGPRPHPRGPRETIPRNRRQGPHGRARRMGHTAPMPPNRPRLGNIAGISNGCHPGSHLLHFPKKRTNYG